MNDAFSDSATGAAGTPTISISRVCCAGKNAQEHIPQSAIAASTGRSARAGVTAFATTARAARATTTPVRLARRTTSVPSRSVTVPLTNSPTPAARPHVDSARPICGPRSNVVSYRSGARYVYTAYEPLAQTVVTARVRATHGFRTVR